MAVKRFNVTGVCIPVMHYMVDTSAKIDTIIRDYIEPGTYFVINRARQYGKTTTLALLSEKLRDHFLVLPLTFEGKEDYFKSSEALANGIFLQFRRLLKNTHPALANIFSTPSNTQLPIWWKLS